MSFPFLACGQYFQKEEMVEDLKEFEYLLFNLHPGLDYFTDTTTLRSMFVATKNALPDSLDRLSFFLKVEPIIDAIQCGHTNLTMAHKVYKNNEEKKKKTLFPAYLTTWNGRLFFNADYEQDWLKIPRGTEIISIDSIPAKEIVRLIAKTNKGADGNTEGSEAAWSVAGFRTTYARFYGLKESHRLEVIKPGKDAIDLHTLKSISYEKILKQTKANEKPPLSYEFIEDDKVAVIKLRTFSNESLFKRTRKHFKKAFQEIKEKNVENLIIDLRNNGGGAISNCNHFLSYLLNEKFKTVKKASLNKNLIKKELNLFQKLLVGTSKKVTTEEEIWLKKYNNKGKKINKDHHFDGKVVVLTNKRSYSASTMFCAILKSHDRAKIMGEVPGGSYHISFAGFSKYLKMKYSKIRIRIPLMRMEYNVNPDLQDNRIPVQPDFIKELNIKDFQEEGYDSLKDSAVEYLLGGT